MKPIKKLTGTITAVTDLSQTAREITITPSEPIDFIAGSFMNMFIEKDGEKLRRAFSIASSDTKGDQISLAIRLTPTGAVTPLFWTTDIVGTEVDLMGPMGLNTADKMAQPNVFLFGFGIGAGVVKSLADHFANKNTTKSLTIITGSRNDTEVVYETYFDILAATHPNVQVTYVVSTASANPKYKTGYIQHHLAAYNFDNSDVYVCGQEKACDDLVNTVKQHNPSNCHFFVEGFH
jgi:aquacobalamin reductase/NAD(P)H-flavin reductase